MTVAVCSVSLCCVFFYHFIMHVHLIFKKYVGSGFVKETEEEMIGSGVPQPKK